MSFGQTAIHVDPKNAAKERSRERADVLGREMVELTAHISAAEARFFELLAEFDREELWRCLGCHSAAQWLMWQCGLGEVAARERVRVARALEKLPKINAAFRRGELSYSKVRELTRAARSETEDALLRLALHGTAAQVQRVVALHCRAERVSGAAEAVEAYRRRYVRYRHDDDGTVVIEARLPVEIGEVVMRAIDAAVEVLYRDAAAAKETESHAPSGSVAGPEAAASSRDGVAGEIGAVDSSMDRAETEGDVSAGTAGRNGETLAFDDVENTNDDDVESTTEVPAGTLAGDDGETGGPEPLAARRADGLRLVAESFLSAPAGARIDTTADRYQVVVHIDQALLSGAGQSRAFANDSPEEHHASRPFPLSELENGRAIAVETARRLACDATLVGIVEDANGEPLSVGRRTRAISPALRRALRARDGGCRFPGCGRSRFTHGHHVVHWANGGETSVKNVLTLCTFHHTLVHEGGYSVRRLDDGSFAFFSPEGERLPETGRRDPRTAEALRRAADGGRVTLLELDLIGPTSTWAARSALTGLKRLDRDGYRC